VFARASTVEGAADQPASAVGDVSAAGVAAPIRAIPHARRLRRFFRIAALVWIIGIVGLALLAPVLPLPDPTQGGLGVARSPFGSHILGTDQLGRDELSRIVFGARTSIILSILSVVIAMVTGVTAGLLAGYFRGKADLIIVAIGDIVLAFPGLVLLLVISALAGPTIPNLIGAIAFFLFPTFMRLARANALNIAQREFVLAARGVGAREIRIAMREVLPNVIPAVRSYALAAIGLVLVIEGSLSFLGLGIQPPTPAWGSMIADGRLLFDRAPQLILIPSLVMFLTVLSLFTMSEGRATDILRPMRLGA
jgi:peptide/nickel transport system permease protein